MANWVKPLLLSTVFVSTLLIGGGVSAAPKTAVAGNIHEGPHEVTSVSNDEIGNQVLTLAGWDHSLSGTFSGPFTEVITLTITPDGTFNYDIAVYFTGTAGGSEPGAVELHVTGTSSDGGTTIAGEWEIVKKTATGGLIGLHGRGHWDMLAGLGNIYGHIHFDSRDHARQH